MRRLGWIGGAVGGITVYRFLRRRRATDAAAEPDARADELREKLAESRAAEEAEPVVEEPLVEEPPAEQAEPMEEEPAAETEEPEPAEPEPPAERRRRVHEEGRAAIDEMRSE
jgi:hypothetical protein